jgi:uncharacterized protein (TIGR02001 family)
MSLHETAARAGPVFTLRGPARRACRLLSVAAIVLLRLAGPAHAETGLSAAVNSDDRVRGVSLSDGNPVLSLNFTYDHASGVYAGISATAVATDHTGIEMLGDVVYLGYAGRLSPETSWDVGVSNSNVSVYPDIAYRYNYTELYAGITRNNISAHLYYSPRYLGGGARTLYGEVNGTWKLASRWRLFAHAGVLTSLGGGNLTYAGSTQFDGRLGLAREFGRCEVRVAWTTTSSAPDFPEGHRQSRNAVVAGAAYNF